MKETESLRPQMYSQQTRKKVLDMSKFREAPCKYYIAYGNCAKDRDADYRGYCQHCDQYCPRARVRHINKKKQYNEKMRGNYTA